MANIFADDFEAYADTAVLETANSTDWDDLAAGAVYPLVVRAVSGTKRIGQGATTNGASHVIYKGQTALADAQASIVITDANYCTLVARTDGQPAVASPSHPYNGYSYQVRQNRHYLHKYVNGTQTTLASDISFTTALTLPITATLKCEGSTITATVTDGTNTETLSATDATHANGYWGFGRAAAVTTGAIESFSLDTLAAPTKDFAGVVPVAFAPTGGFRIANVPFAGSLPVAFDPSGGFRFFDWDTQVRYRIAAVSAGAGQSAWTETNTIDVYKRFGGIVPIAFAPSGAYRLANTPFGGNAPVAFDPSGAFGFYEAPAGEESTHTVTLCSGGITLWR